MTDKPDDTGRDPETGRFLPGHGFGGRNKGARAIFSEAFARDMLTVWQEGGIDAIRRTMEDRPAEFLRVAAGLLPRDVKLEHSASAAFQAVLDALNGKAADEMAERLDREHVGPEAVRH